MLRNRVTRLLVTRSRHWHYRRRRVPAATQLWSRFSPQLTVAPRNFALRLHLQVTRASRSAALRLDQSVLETVGTRKLITTVPVRKPNQQEFFRVHPDPAYRLTPAAVIELKDERETYLVLPAPIR